jgi:hypothetical protein
MFAENVGGDHASELISVLIVVGVVLNIYQALAMRISEVRPVRWSQVNLFFGQGVLDLKIISTEASRCFTLSGKTHVDKQLTTFLHLYW